MIKPRCLLLNGIFWLVWAIALTSTSAAEDPTRDLTTAAARRAALVERLSQRPAVEASGDRAALVQLDNEIVQLYIKLWDMDSAAQEAQCTLDIAEQLAGSAEAETRIRLADVYIVDSDRAYEVTALLQQAATICRSLDDKPCLATALIDLGYQAIKEGQWQTALSFFNQVEDLQIENEAEPYIAGGMAMGFGLVYETYGQLETARDYFADCLRYYRDGAHDKRAAADAGSKLARVLAMSQNYTEAHQRAQESLTAALETQNNLSIGLSHESLGRVWLQTGAYASARSEFI